MRAGSCFVSTRILSKVRAALNNANGKEITVEPQWLEHLWDHGNSFETWIVRANEG